MHCCQLLFQQPCQIFEYLKALTLAIGAFFLSLNSRQIPQQFKIGASPWYFSPFGLVFPP
ncbi:hypothetical protein D082_00870 [Synechocystis sp. PCC 6714]|nr:hypothetical protein D082_00870 [Synechocystis sp. PCC 6714]